MFRGSEAIKDGILTPTQLRSTAWRRLRQDVYMDSRVDPDHEVMCRAVAMTLAGKLVFAGPSAAFLHGIKHAAGDRDKVHAIMSKAARLHRHQGMTLHQIDISDAELLSVRGLICTTPLRTAWDVATMLAPAEAVAIADALLAMRLVSKEELIALAASHRGRRGSQMAANVFDLADAGAQSAPESHLRVGLIRAGIPRPVTQHPVPAGYIVLHPDMAWPEFLVALEYDGHWHADADQLHMDRARLNRLVGAGWTVLHVTSRRLYRDFDGVVAEVRAALMSRGWPG
ncbi:MAG TPA: hypothetical protein DGT23_05995 [Micromonosporaceae bacterium]|nr:hypothetical protein [Micromonosporaceae bacterium]